MRTKDIAVVGVMLVLVAAGAYKLFARSPKARTHAPIAAAAAAAADKDSGAIDGQIKELQQQLAGLRQQVARQELLAASSASSAPASTASAEAAPAAPDHAAEQQRMQAEMDRVAADFEAEPRDANWSRDITTAFQAQFENRELLKNALQSLECRTTTCRLEMLDNRTPAFFNQLNQAALKLGRQLPSMAGQRLTRADGKAVFVYYFSKNS